VGRAAINPPSFTWHLVLCSWSCLALEHRINKLVASAALSYASASIILIAQAPNVTPVSHYKVCLNERRKREAKESVRSSGQLSLHRILQLLSEHLEQRRADQASEALAGQHNLTAVGHDEGLRRLPYLASLPLRAVGPAIARPVAMCEHSSYKRRVSKIERTLGKKMSRTLAIGARSCSATIALP
jgi:hypothetical protein